MRTAHFLLPVLLLSAQAASGVETDQQPSPLVNSTWTVTDLGGEKPPEGARLTIEFHVPGQIAGHGGCNRFGGVCRFDEDLIHVTRLRSTRRACDEPVMERELRFLTLLEAAISWEVKDDTLVLGGPEGEIRARREPEDAAQAAE